LPAEYENSIDGLNDILQEAWTITTESDSDKRERMQALSLAKECYAMKLELLSSATVTDGAVKFVERHRGLIQENEKVAMGINNNDSAEPIENTGQVRPAASITQASQFELLKGLPFYDCTKPSLGNWINTFNKALGLPQKNGQSYLLFDYEALVFETLQKHKHVWIKKATGLILPS
jgi:hypothetical protein